MQHHDGLTPYVGPSFFLLALMKGTHLTNELKPNIKHARQTRIQQSKFAQRVKPVVARRLISTIQQQIASPMHVKQP